MSKEQDPSADTNPGQLSEQQVCDFLRSRSNFFERHPDLLESLELPHSSGGAVSLVERQIGVLRERNLDMRRRLDALVATARRNDHLFELTRRLVLSLLEAEDLDALINALNTKLSNEFELEFHRVVLFSQETFPCCKGATLVDPDAAHHAIGHITRSHQAVCGVLRDEELQFLFGTDASSIRSVAVIPLHRGGPFGLVAIGSADPQRYKSSLGTLFLSYIGDVLERLLPPLLASARSGLA